MAKKRKPKYYVYQVGGENPTIDFKLPKLNPNAPLNPDEAPVDARAEKEKFKNLYFDLFATPEQKNAARMRELESRGLTDRPTMEQDEYDMFGQGDPTLQQKKGLGLFDPRKTELHPFFRGLNTLIDIGTGIGAKVNNVRAAKQEQQEYLDAIAPEEYENMERYGLNELPIFTKYGGVAKYQTGGNATRQDSLDLYNNANQLLQYYDRYEKGFNSRLKIPKKELFDLIDYDQEVMEGRKVALVDGEMKELGPNAYRKPIDKNKFYQRESANVIVDLRAPMALYDRRIAPTHYRAFKNTIPGDMMHGDNVGIYTYDPIAVKPWDMLTPEERAQRMKLYPPTNITPSHPPVKFPNHKASKVKGVDMTDNIQVEGTGLRPTDLSQKPTKYSVTVRDEDSPSKQRNIYFKNKKEWRDFVDSGAVSTISTSETDDSATAAGYPTMKTGGKNFKSGAAYKKWLAYGHATGVFEATPGHQKVSIKGKAKNVKHQLGGMAAPITTMASNPLAGAVKQDEPDPNMTYYQTNQAVRDARLADMVNNVLAKGIDPYSKEGRAALNPSDVTFGTPQFGNDLSFKIKAFQADPSYNRMSAEQRLERFYTPSASDTTSDFAKFINRARVLGGSPGAFYQNSPYNPNNQAARLKERELRNAPTITFQYGGDSIPTTKGLPNNANDLANVEAERGEAYMDFMGNVFQVAEDAKTHEQGGEMLPQVHRVLENTSNLRKDRNSKYLRVDPKQFKALTGVDTTKMQSHAEAMVKANNAYDKKREEIVKKIKLASDDKIEIDKMAENSIKLNMDHFAAIPTKQQIFDKMFEHQEAVKMAASIPTGRDAKYGGYMTGGKPKPKYKYQVGGGFTAYPGNRSGMKTPAGRYDAFPTNMTLQAYLEDLQKKGFKYEGISGNKQLQSALYDYVLQTDPQRIRNMWQEGMHQAGMAQAQQLGFVDEKGMFKPGVLDNPENLKKLGELYPDDILGVRTMQLAAPPKKPRVWTDNPIAGTPEQQQKLDTGIKANIRRGQTVESRFFEPLRWYDTASPINAYLASLERIPEKYNPAEFNQLRYKLLDPTANLQQNQADFNAAVQSVNNTTGAGAGVQLANIANLATRKYAMNNQVLGNYENQNAQIKNQEILYNTQVRDKQSVADQQAREVFEDKVLTSKAKQQEQKLTALDALYKTIAENRALNRNGNLIMKMSRAFDQYGNYNGYQTQFGVNPMLGMGAPALATSKFQPAGGIQGLTPGKSYYNRRSGKTLYFDGMNLLER